MTATMTTHDGEDTDQTIWSGVLAGDVRAFEELVRRHQSAVASVAYSICGDIALSEDVAQETFLAAWKQTSSLADSAKVRAWLCGIARNLARNSRRRESSSLGFGRSLHEPGWEDGIQAGCPDPHESAVSQEEESLVWQALSEIPENYREPLILFYREHQSVGEVAVALDVSPDAIKQRLARGREMIRQQVESIVERTLLRSRPRAEFTLGVMAGIAALSAGSKSALAATAGVGVGAVAKGLQAGAVPAAIGPIGAAAGPGFWGLFGMIFGPLMGLIGGWLGVWLPAQFAPTNRERLFQMKMGKRILIFSIVLTLLFAGALLFAVSQRWLQRSMGWWIGALVAGYVMLLNLTILVHVVLMMWGVKRIRAETSPESDPNTSSLKAYIEQKGFGAMDVPGFGNQWEGRVYRSRATWMGIPWIDINVSDPPSLIDRNKSGTSSFTKVPPKQAYGWIAIGDRANGILVGIGGRATGFIAIGGLALGLISFGGLAVGGLSLGGLAIGAYALGGAGIGGVAFGGLALGWQALGGLAIAGDVAAGGGAIAYHAAFGGGALAHDYALGGGAYATHANDEAAKLVLENHWLVRAVKWQSQNNALVTTIIVVISVLPSLLLTPLMYRKKKSVSNGDAVDPTGTASENGSPGARESAP